MDLVYKVTRIDPLGNVYGKIVKVTSPGHELRVSEAAEEFMGHREEFAERVYVGKFNTVHNGGEP